MLNFKTVRYKNLLSTGNNWTEVDLGNSKRNLILGENGAGKSTVIDAICFALFGKSFRGSNKPQLINSINDRNMVVELEFGGNGNEYKIIRGMKPNIFEVYSNSVLISQSASSKDYQDHLEKNILNTNFRSFTQTEILGSSNYVPFMRQPLAARRAFIEELLDLTIFSKMNILLKDKVQQNKDDLGENEKLITIEKAKLKLYRENAKKNKESLQKRMEENNNEITETRADLATIHTEITSLNDSIRNKTLDLSDFMGAQEKETKFRQLGYAVAKNVESLEKKLQFFKETSVCPTCSQDLDENFKHEHIDSIAKKKEELSEKHQILQTKLSEFESTIKRYQQVNKEISEISTKLAERKILHDSKFGYLKKLMERATELSSEIVASGVDNQITEVETALKVFEGKKEALISSREIMSYSGNLLKDSGIKTKIIQQYIPIINNSISTYLQSMDFYVNFELDENFEEKISARNKNEFTYWNFSEGERQRIDLALLFTFRQIARIKNSLSTNLLFLDEIFDSSLDNSGTDELLRILDTLTNTSVFVISHKSDHLQDKFENVIRFKKVNDFSVKDANV